MTISPSVLVNVTGARGPQGVANPGGSSGQVQYNNAGNFGGVTGLTLIAGTLSQIATNSGTITASAPAVTITQHWNNAGIRFFASIWDITTDDTDGNPTSNFIQCKLGGVSIVEIQANANLQLGNPATAYGGIRKINQVGAAKLGLWSQRNVSTGDPADVMTFQWDDSILNGTTTSTTAVLRGHGSNRFSIESDAAMILMADNSHFEFEGTDNVDIVGYLKASSVGTTIKFTNQGQDGNGVCPVAAVTDNHNVDVFQMSYRSGSDTVMARFDGNGAPSFFATTATPAGGSTTARLVFGTTAGFGIYIGSGAPTVSAAQGSMYLRSDGSTTNNRAYINTNGSTTWTALTTVA